MKRVIVTGDDFGLAPPANEAIIEAHRTGILTTASLMVGAGAAGDAVEQALRFPSLKVGLHLVLVEGRSVLPRPSIPLLVDAGGEFSNQPTRAGFRYALVPGIRKQLEAEIRAQFEAFRKTGLPLDHANTHNHLHLHPRIFDLILAVGREYGLRAVRLPHEPPLVSWRASRASLLSRSAGWFFLLPLLTRMKRRLRKANLRFNDFIFGLFDTGAMTADRLLRLVPQLPEGVSEIYCHPSTRRCSEIDRTMPDYRNEEEFLALKSISVREAFDAAGVRRVAFSDL